MPYTPILATLGYVLSADQRRVLMIHRNARDEDIHIGKYNGLGGKLEAGEDVVAGMRREIREEAGIECLALALRGTISWPGFGKNGEDWFGFVFVVTQFCGTPLERNAEGALEWIDLDAIGKIFLLEIGLLFTACAFYAVNYLQYTLTEMLDNVYGDYLVDRGETMLRRREAQRAEEETMIRGAGHPPPPSAARAARLAPGAIYGTDPQGPLAQANTPLVGERQGTTIYPRLSLAPGQRYASKGAYIVRFAGDSGEALQAESDWIVP